MLGMVFIAVLALPLLLYLPGWLLSWALPGARPIDPLERHYERVVVSVLLSGWLALILASFGVFTLWLQLGLLLLGCGGLGYYCLKRARHAPISPGAAPISWLEIAAFALIGLIALLLVIRPFEVVLGARDAGVYANTGFAIASSGSLIQHDPLLAELGQAARSSDPALRGPAEQALSNFLGVQSRDRYIATRLRDSGFLINEGDAAQGRVTPQFLHLFPVWIGLLSSVLGLTGGLFAPGLMAVLGAWSVGMLGRRLVNGWVGALAFLLLALNGVQVWFGRYTTAETTAQFLIFAGLYFFAKAVDLGERSQAVAQGEPASAGSERQPLLYALLTGVAIGQVALTRIDFFLLGPVLIYLLYCFLARRWTKVQTGLSIGLGLMLLHAALHILFIARAYFFDTGFNRFQDYALIARLVMPLLTPAVQESYAAAESLSNPLRFWLELALLLVGLAGVLALRFWPARWGESPLLRGEALLRRWQRPLLTISALALVLLAVYAYLIRPQILDQTVIAAIPSCLSPEQLRNPTGPCLTLQGYIGAPIKLPLLLWYEEYEDMSWWERLTVSPDQLTSTPVFVNEKYTIPLANLVRVGWYLSPLGIVLGVAGFVLWWRRGLNRASWLLLVVGLLGTFFYVRQTYGTSDQTYIYILRRFVPITYPLFSLCIAYALVALAGKVPSAGWSVPLAGAWRAWWRVAPLLALSLAGGLIAFLVWTNRPIYRHVEYAGALAQLEEVAQRFDPQRDILLFRGGGPFYSSARDFPDLVATPLHYGFGINTFTVKSSQPGAYADALGAQLRHWQATGHNVYVVLSASGGSFALPGFTLQPAGSFTLNVPEFEQLTNQKPRNVAWQALPFAVYRLEAGQPDRLAALNPPLTPNDFAAQITGFYRPEQQMSAVATTSPLTAESYAWTSGDALLRLTWPASAPTALSLRLGGGERPPHLGNARVCLSLQAEDRPWPLQSSAALPLGCLDIDNAMTTYTIPLDPRVLPAPPLGTVLLRIESATWVPADEDPRQNDQRPVGVQFGGMGDWQFR